MGMRTTWDDPGVSSPWLLPRTPDTGEEAPEPLSAAARPQAEGIRQAEKVCSAPLCIRARLRRRIRRIRLKSLHKLSTTLRRPGRRLNSGIRRNAHLGQPIAEAAGENSLGILEYWTQWYGCRLLVADRSFPSNRACSACGHVVSKMPLHVRKWTGPAVPACGRERE